jgi:hypothetical protein
MVINNKATSRVNDTKFILVLAHFQEGNKNLLGILAAVTQPIPIPFTNAHQNLALCPQRP